MSKTIHFSKEENKLIHKGIEDLNSGGIHTHKEVIELGKKKIIELKKRI